ncbi:uncharacterized protein LOC113771310 [Coffea eugenioides]|uniref:uncharacterized protein LOC113771310 n=1 Tax=Coffea eugenioides TaxID=49369 RepID=UPI000F613613|nr:uncharacterized protein LOC113771310 [Coffea eugenioides]
MPQSEKAALLRRRSEARAAKKRNESSRSFVRSVPLGYVETGVFFPDPCSHRDSNIQDSQNDNVTLNEMVRHSSLGFANDQGVLIREGLDYMASSGSTVTNVSSPAPSSVVPIESNPFPIIPEETPLIGELESGRNRKKTGAVMQREEQCGSSHDYPAVKSSRKRQQRRNTLSKTLTRPPRNSIALPNEINQRFNIQSENSDNVFCYMNEPNSEINNVINYKYLDHFSTDLASSSTQVDSRSRCLSEVIQPCGQISALQHQAEADVAKRRKRDINPSNLPAAITSPRPTHSHPVRSRPHRTGPNGTGAKIYLSRIEVIPDAPLLLPDAPDCQYCGAKRFYLEPPTFCCSKGEISIVAPRMPYALKRLFTENDEESEHFRKLARTYNNNLAFTAFAAKYDSELTKNTKGVYTFRVQGQVYHFLNGLSESTDRSSGIQLYIFDTDEQLKRRVASCDKLRETTLRLLMDILSENPYARFFKDLRDVPNINNFNIALNCYPALDQRVYNLPSTSQVAAIWTESDDQSLDKQAHILVYTHSNTSYRIQHYYGCYDPLQYPLLFPRGESGWHHGIKRVYKRKRGDDLCEDEINIDPSSVEHSSDLIDLERRAADRGKKEEYTVSAREYYCYRFQIRDNDESMLLHTLRLLQQFSVDGYVKIETSRLDFQRKRQNDIRTEILEGVIDSLSVGQTEGSKVGRKVILPASFIGGPRDMRRRYLDAMALVQKYGKPDIFLTMTCNPMWKEIQDNLQFTEKPQDRPDLLSRVFRAKFEMLKSELLDKKIFGEVAACVYVIEFQKRGFPHAHLLLILKPQFKLLNPQSYDRIVSAELPNPHQYPHLYSLVLKHMIHGPCGVMDQTSPCMKNGSCKNHYPKNFCEQTVHAEDTYPCYRRRDDGRKIKVRRNELDNRWVIPYCPYLLALFDCHMNVEICSTLKLVKYLYKYVFKGHDLVSFKIVTGESSADVDEIKEFQQGRWISPPEAFWRIYEFRLNEMTPAVYSLQVHLPGQQFITFNKNSDLLELMRKIDFSKTMLTEFFEMNKAN